MSKNVVMVVAVVLVLGGVVWFLTRPQQTPTVSDQSQTPTSTQSAAPSASEGAAMMESKNMVSITASSFSPQDITIKVGESVIWENTDTADHTVNSAPHPTHTLYPFLNVGTVKSGEKKSVTFEKAGTYKYHDHLNPSLTGSVTVQ